MMGTPSDKRMMARARATFLEALRAGDSVKGAAAKVGVHSAVFYRQRRRYPEFGMDWDAAYKAGDSNPQRNKLDGRRTQTHLRSCQRCGGDLVWREEWVCLQCGRPMGMVRTA